jgi:uncharacterized protein (TIGR02145 family)
MFFKTLVTKWEGVGRCTRIPPHAVGHYYVFNVNNVTQLKEYGTGSEFLYADHPYDRKTGYSKIQCATSYATVKDEFDIPPASNILELSIFKKKNPANDQETIYVNTNDFSYAWSHSPYPQYTWLRYCLKGGKDKYVLVNMTLDDLLELDFVFDEENIQWYFFVDPDELIHPTWFIRVEEIIEIKHGRLYNWYAANDSRSITPEGWRIPNNNDFLTLQTYLGGEAVAGGKLKEIGTDYWLAPNVGATNEVGFNGKASGFRSIAGWIDNISQILAMWTLNEFDEDTAYYTPILNSLASMAVGSNAASKKYGCSLRPIKNSTTLIHGEENTYLGNDGDVYRTICIGTQEWLADNLAETKYRDGTTIPEVTDDTTWAGLTTGAVCVFNNDWNNI